MAVCEKAKAPMDFFLWGFAKNIVYILPLPATLHELKTRIREDCANIDQEILHNVWQEVEYRFDDVPGTLSAHIELN
jgi:hypothetical protein